MITITELAERLASQALPVCLMLIPGGKERRGEYVCGSVHGGEGESLKVQLNGTHAGQWRDWASDGDRGDLIDLWRAARNFSPGEAIQAAKSYLGINDGMKPAERKKYKAPPEIKSTPPSQEGQAFRWLTETRKLSTETIAAFRLEIQPGTRTIVFPSFSPTGILENRSYRTLPPPGEKKKVWQDKDCAPCMFGWHTLPKSAYSSKTVLLAEGQIDAMTWHQWGIPALSIPSGSGQNWIEYEWDNLQAFETLYIAFDMDGAGREIAERAVKRLGAHRCRLVVIPHKDANEALQARATAADAQQWIADARHPEFRGLITAGELETRIIAHCQPRPKAFTLPCFDKKWPEDGLYFRPGELTVWTGIQGNGKSTFLNSLAIDALKSGAGVYIASMESKVEVILERLMIAFLTSLGCYLTATGSFRDKAGEEHPREEAFRGFLRGVGQNLVFADEVGYIEQERLLEMMMFAFRKYGSRQFFVDSLMRVEGLEEDYPAQGRFMNRLQEFVKNTGSHVHLVVHPRKIEKGSKPTGTDLKGASLLANNADTIVAVIRNQEKVQLLCEKDWHDLDEDERSMHDTEIIVDKQRDSGWVGSFFFHFDRRDFTFTPCKKYHKPAPTPKRRDW